MRGSDLPLVLIEEIMLRLAVKPLLRFKSACKEWCAIFACRRFVDRHYGRESNQDRLLFQLRERDNNDDDGVDQEPRDFSLYPDDDGLSFNMASSISRYDHILGPANGIFCGVDTNSSDIVLFNPATGELKLLPPPRELEIESLVYNPLVFGFGFDHSSGDYKVVVFEFVGEKSRYFYRIYKSSSGSWGGLEVTDDALNFNEYMGAPDMSVWFYRAHMICWHNRHRTDDVFINGVYYRTALRDPYSLCILGFDMRSETFHQIPTPSDATRDVCISAYGDSLALLALQLNGSVDLWVMGRDGPGLWSNSFNIPIQLPQLPITQLSVWNKNELLIELVEMASYHDNDNGDREKIASVVFKCDISTHEMQHVELAGEGDVVFRIFSYKYKEGLYSIEGRNREGDDDDDM